MIFGQAKSAINESILACLATKIPFAPSTLFIFELASQHRDY